MKNNGLMKYYALDLIFSIIGFIFVCILYVYVKEMQQIFIILVATYFAIKIVHIMSKMEKKRRKPKTIKYSMRMINLKNIKKLSH